MAKRGYNQACNVAGSLDLLGERWTLLIVRELLTGPRRYRDLLDALPGIGTNLLAARLKGLSEEGLVTQRRVPPPTPASVYELTEAGRALEPVLLELVRWGLRYRKPAGKRAFYRPTSSRSSSGLRGHCYTWSQGLCPESVSESPPGPYFSCWSVAPWRSGRTSAVLILPL